MTAALKFFRQCIGLQDEFYNRQITQKGYFTNILDIVYETMPRDNLLNSACLELFEFIKRENLKPLIIHLVETCRPRLQEITYVDTFQTLILRYDQMQGYNPDADTTLFSNDGSTTPNETPNVNGTRWQGVKDREMDPAEEDYFNGSDEEDETLPRIKKQRRDSVITNGVATSPMLKSLVDYPDDDDDAMDTSSSEPVEKMIEPKLSPSPMLQTPPPERLSEKRRREENDDEDELGKLTTIKRRNSGPSVSSTGSNNTLKRKKAFVSKNENRDSLTEKGGIKKIEISLGAKSAGAEQGSKDHEGG